MLPTFFLATAVMVLAVVALDRIQSALGEAGAIFLAVVAAGCVLAAIGRMLAEQTQPDHGLPDAGEGSP